jgi:hypothetical protein
MIYLTWIQYLIIPNQILGLLINASKSRPTDRNAKRAFTPDLLLQMNLGDLSLSLPRSIAVKARRISVSDRVPVPFQGSVTVLNLSTCSGHCTRNNEIREIIALPNIISLEGDPLEASFSRSIIASLPFIPTIFGIPLLYCATQLA